MELTFGGNCKPFHLGAPYVTIKPLNLTNAKGHESDRVRWFRGAVGHPGFAITIGASASYPVPTRGPDPGTRPASARAP
jgi:hypothetical protein